MCPFKLRKNFLSLVETRQEWIQCQRKVKLHNEWLPK